MKKLCMLLEADIKSTEVALAVEAMADQLDTIVSKLSSMQTKDLSNLVKGIKYNNDIETANALQQNIGEKLTAALNTITELKSDLETEVVNLMNGNPIGGGSKEDEESDFSAEFNPDEEEGSDEETEKDDTVSDKEADEFDGFDEMERTLKDAE